MASVQAESSRMFEQFIAQTGNTYVFDDQTSVYGFGLLFKVIAEMGLDPLKTEELKTALIDLFHIEIINMPDLKNGRFILAPNHVSDFDALILGLLHPKIRVVAKSGWVNNEKLRQFMDLHYDLCSIDRTSLLSLRGLMKESIDYFSDGENKHFLVFSQGTISDFNHNSLERISAIAAKISGRAGVPIVNVFIEQVSLYHPTRIVFDSPQALPAAVDFRSSWLEQETFLQNTLLPPPRSPNLSYKHSNNNKPGDPFF